MFQPGEGAATGPALAPIFTDFAAGDGLVAYLENMRANNGTTQAAMLAIIGKLAQEAPNATDLGRNCALMFAEGTAANILEALTQDNAAENAVEADNLVKRMANGQLDGCVKWICDLVNGSKKKELTGDNVEGYFESLGRSDLKGAPVASMINKIANFLPDEINNDEFRNNLTDNMWNQYHISRVSTGKLLFEIRDQFIAMGIYDEGDATDEAIIASKDSPYDIQLSREIPSKVVGYASLFFQAAGKDVGKWYQGEKFEADIPAAKLRTIRQIFSRYLQITATVGDIAGANTVAELNETIDEGFW